MNSEGMRVTLRITKALSDIQRVRILMMLKAGELCVCRIVEVLGLAPSTVSKHLSILNHAGLVEMRKEGRWAYYSLPGGARGKVARPLLKWLEEALKDDEAIGRDAVNLRKALACDPEVLCRKQRARE